jgi:hypothetical protein
VPALCPPFRDTVIQATRADALSTKEFHGIERHDAVRPAAVRDDVMTLA